jgi:competence protein ComEC
MTNSLSSYEKIKFMPVFTIAFLTGIVLVQQLTQLPSLFWLIVCGVCTLFCAWRRVWFLAAVFLGILWASLFALDRLNDRLPKVLEQQEFNVTGYVISLPQQDDKRVSFDFHITQAAQKLPEKIRLSWYNPTQVVKAGQLWQMMVKLKRPHGLFNPAGFDYETWLFNQNIGATGYIRKPEPQLVSAPQHFYSVNLWRQAISEQLTRLVPDRDSLALIKALSIGDGNEISDAQWQVFRKTGTLHLIVISGSHISLVAGLIFFLSQKLWARTGILAISPPTFAACAALSVALFYSALAGFSVPTQRAMIMVAVAMLGIIWQRHINLIQTLSLALLLVLITDPLAVLSPGFWLSFAAVIIIVYCNANRLGKPSWWFPTVNIHLVLTLGLAPLLLLFFQQISIISPLANFIAVPVIELVTVPLILLSLAVIFLQPIIASQLLTVISHLLQWLYILLNQLALLPVAVVNHPQPNAWTVVLALLGMLLLFAPKGVPARSLSLVLCLPLVFGKTEKIKPGELTLTLLDVGQGLAAVVQTANHVLVFDTGAKTSPDFDMGKVAVLPFLYHQGITQIDRLIISHGDNDHIGGMASLLAEMKTDSIYTSVPQQLTNHTPIACIAGQQWQWDDIYFTMLSPTKNLFDSENNNSCVLKITAQKGSVLLTGDIEMEAEQKLVADFGTALKTDILIAPHHGSKTSSTAEFLQKVAPELILIPAGYKNRYHFPHPSVIANYQKQKINWLMTGTVGAIKVKIAHKRLESFSYRTHQAKYWHDK